MTLRRSRQSPWVTLFVIATTILCLICVVRAASDDDTFGDVKKWYNQAKESYENLPDQGKFATGAVCGFGASKVVVNSAVKFVKLAGAAFIATEVLEAVGVIDMDELVTEKQTESMKKRVMGRLGDIKRSITHFDLKQMVKNPKQKAGALGIAAGALVGFLL
ncbi:hypothetical protein IV203_008176 [Nitzschia inconspicua]|uniref:Uncharacterized protein n=1 Tax=Nitzschia inconspicua TaxID=303405 RepID=A0A9K3K5P3_9STRA|nr:hypothetical protein IV203_011099 [Nitzschia inconspicua]KAG7352128.1 hypothetical protein IV203_008176 [Nitzschia inconspicua]